MIQSYPQTELVNWREVIMSPEYQNEAGLCYPGPFRYVSGFSMRGAIQSVGPYPTHPRL